MMKICFSIILLLMCVNGIAQKISADELEIYRLVIDSNKDVNYIDSTSTIKQIVVESEMKGHIIPPIESIATKDFKVDEDMYEDLKSKSLKTIIFDNLHSRLPVRYITEEAISSVFSTNKSLNGWTDFYKTYPDSQGILTLSAIGFNKDHTKAILYYGSQYDVDGGSGYYVIYSFDGRHWKQFSKRCVWVS